MKERLERIALSSKFVGRRIPGMFPDDSEVKVLQAVFADKWLKHEFDTDDWPELMERAGHLLKGLFP